MVKAYYQLTKPGIIYGNLLTAAAGFFLASKGSPDLWLLAATLSAIALIIACACVFNNYLDRDIDKQMKRTADRALATGAIAPRSALIYATILGIMGFVMLGLFTNLITFAIGLVGLVSYVGLYTFAKRVTLHGTLIGSISGSTSLVAGYCAVTNSFDLAALILFMIMAIWQMPHFYAIATYRLTEYKHAKIPVLPIVKGVGAAKLQIFLYVAGFIAASMLLTTFGYTGYVYLVVMTTFGAGWLWLSFKGFESRDSDGWARQLFRYSLVVLVVFSVMISLNSYLV